MRQIYAPLNDFFWSGSNIELGHGVRITRFASRPDLSGLDSSLSQDEQDTLFVDHWLTFDWDEGTQPSSAETVNMVLLALWLVKPTKLHVAFRFEVGSESSLDRGTFVRLLDRFAWVPDTTHDDFQDADVQHAASHYRALHDLCCTRGRLLDALILTLSGCWSIQWQTALICYAAASEAILTHATGPGITRRLSTSYACLVEAQQADRDHAYREFTALYSVRSDIMHGRTHNVLAADRLPTLVRFRDVLRRLWCVVLSSPQLIPTLEGTDAQREAHFLRIQAGYTPPP